MELCAIILDYRGAHKTEVCLQSLVSQGIDTVLVVDNSADALSSVRLAEVAARLSMQGTDFALHVLEPGKNLGFAGGVNYALTHAAGQHCNTILLLNNDASVAPGSILEMSHALAAGGASLVGPAIIDDDGASQPMLWYQRYFGIQSKRALPGSFPYLSGCCLLFQRELTIQGKLFDEKFFMYGEDALLGWRMTLEGKTVKLVESATVRHTGQSTLQKCTLFYEYHMARAHVLLAMKTFRNVAEIPLLLASKSCGLALRAARRCIRYKSAIPLWAFFLAWIPLNVRKTS